MKIDRSLRDRGAETRPMAAPERLVFAPPYMPPLALSTARRAAPPAGGEASAKPNLGKA